MSEVCKFVNMKYLIILDEQGILTLNMVIHVKKELKTFLLQLRGNVAEQMSSPDFDFRSLDYFDINSRIKDSTKSVSLMYLVYDCYDIPEDIYKKLQVDKHTLQNHEANMIKQFIELREENNVVKAIKFKEEIINCTYQKEKWATMDNVMNKLVVNQATNSKG